MMGTKEGATPAEESAAPVRSPSKAPAMWNDMVNSRLSGDTLTQGYKKTPPERGAVGLERDGLGVDGYAVDQTLDVVKTDLGSHRGGRPSPTSDGAPRYSCGRRP